MSRTRIALLLSLALNLFLAGLILGSVLTKTRTHEPRGPGRGPRAFWAAAEALDPADREALREVLRERAHDAAPRVRVLRRARREAAEAMAAQEYDPQAVRSALARARSEETALRRELDDAVIAFAARLDPEERAALGEALRRRGGQPRRDRRPGPPPS